MFFRKLSFANNFFHSNFPVAKDCAIFHGQSDKEQEKKMNLKKVSQDICILSFYFLLVIMAALLQTASANRPARYGKRYHPFGGDTAGKFNLS